jgi:hypothetical protein
MDHPDHLPQIPVRLTIEQMYQISEDFRPWIRNLRITDSERMTVEQLAYLARAFPRLQTLNLWDYQGDIEPLRGLVNLRVLYLRSYQGDNIEPLRNLRSLQWLHLANYRGDLEPLRGLRNLRELYLYNYRGDLELLRGLVNLQYLDLRRHPNQAAVRALKRELGIE